METQHEITILLCRKHINMLIGTIKLLNGYCIEQIDTSRLITIYKSLRSGSKELIPITMYITDIVNVIAFLSIINKAINKNQIFEYLAFELEFQVAMQITPEQLQEQNDLLEIEKLLEAAGI